jgi:hypothetical protein
VQEVEGGKVIVFRVPARLAQQRARPQAPSSRLRIPRTEAPAPLQPHTTQTRQQATGGRRQAAGEGGAGALEYSNVAAEAQQGQEEAGPGEGRAPHADEERRSRHALPPANRQPHPVSSPSNLEGCG